MVLEDAKVDLNTNEDRDGLLIQRSGLEMVLLNRIKATLIDDRRSASTSFDFIVSMLELITCGY